MRVFIGRTNIANQIPDLKLGFERLNAKVITEDSLRIKSPIRLIKFLEKSKYLGIIYSYIQKKILFIYSTYYVDIFIFLWSSFRTDHRDLKKLKAKGKKIVVLFAGDDIRYRIAANQEADIFKLQKYEIRQIDIEILEKNIRYLRIAEKYADLIYSVPNQSQLALRPYYHFKVPINLDFFKNNPTQRERPLVIHAPSESNVKGTKYVIQAIKDLQERNIPFNFKLLENIPFNKIIEEYYNADILIGQLIIPGGGKQERECLASGCVVLSNMSYNYPQNISTDCPIIDVNPNNIAAELERIIMDHPRRLSLALKGRPWVEKHHDTSKFCKEILENLKSPREPDFKPTFFRNNFKPVKNHLHLFITMNNFVKDCDWFKDHVKDGNRDGIVF